jgi:hypothetical protein
LHLSEHEQQITAERQKVYGDPLTNHHGIAMAWAGLLQPWHDQIKRCVPVPPHVVALMLAGGMKVNRCRLVYHADNYDDAAVYLKFANEWQRAFDAGTLPMQRVWNGERPSDA